MKYISNLLVVVAVLCLALLTSTGLFAQEWSAAQKVVWKTVEAHWKVDAQGDLEGFLSYVHPDFRGWSYQDPLPGDKASLKRWVGHRMQREKRLLHELKPVSIQIYGDVAVTLYYYTVVVKDAEGKETTRSGRWTDRGQQAPSVLFLRAIKDGEIFIIFRGRYAKDSAVDTVT